MYAQQEQRPQFPPPVPLHGPWMVRGYVLGPISLWHRPSQYNPHANPNLEDGKGGTPDKECPRPQPRPSVKRQGALKVLPIQFPSQKIPSPPSLGLQKNENERGQVRPGVFPPSARHLEGFFDPGSIHSVKCRVFARAGEPAARHFAPGFHRSFPFQRQGFYSNWPTSCEVLALGSAEEPVFRFLLFPFAPPNGPGFWDPGPQTKGFTRTGDQSRGFLPKVLRPGFWDPRLRNV